MAKEYYCYPREGFVPEVCTHEGLCLAHAQGTPFWLSEKGDVFIRYANRRWHRRIVDTCARKSYNTRTPNGVIRGRIYPGVTYKGVHYRVHILMALAWIGSIPAGWQVDHINGAYPHGTGLDRLHSRWLAGGSYQRRHQQLDARQHPYRDRGGELPMRGYTAGKAHGGTARQ